MFEEIIYDETKIPNNETKLNDVEDLLISYSKQLSYLNEKKNSDYDKINKLDNNIYSCLLYLGELSIPLFSLMDDIEETYFKHPKYKGQPDKAKNAWLKFYRGHHARYDFLKNRAHRLMNKLEFLFPSEIRCKHKNFEYV
jgi:hypothetical protein